MSNLRGITAEKKLSVLSKALSFLCMTAHADEVDPVPDDTNSGTATSQINYEQLIAQARKEEKEKLYPRIKKLEEDNAKLVKTGNDNLIKIGDLTQTVNTLTAELDSYKSGATTTEEVKKLNAQIEALTAENEKLKKEAPDVEQLRAEIEKEYEVKSYLAEQKVANKETVLTSFLDDITGSTKEEIDASVAKAKEKSLSIKKELGLVDDNGNPVGSSNNTGTITKPVVKKPPVMNPTENAGTDTGRFDAEYVRNLDPSSEEYKEFRKRLGLK